MEYFRFKKINPRDKIYLNGGYFSNCHWLFDTEWLKALPKSRLTQGLKRCLIKSELAAIKARLTGENSPLLSMNLEKFVSLLSLDNYREVDIFDKKSENKIKKIQGYLKDDYSKKPVAFSFSCPSGDSIYIDVEYFAALAFDKSAKILVKNGNSPVLLFKENKLIGAVMPLNPEYLKRNLNRGNKNA